MADLNNFGAVIAHALALEQALAAQAEAAGDTQRATDSRRRARELTRIRQEAISEMILEPLSGIEEISLDGLSPEEAAQRMAAFYENAAEHMSIPDVARALRRLARRCR